MVTDYNPPITGTFHPYKSWLMVLSLLPAAGKSDCMLPHPMHHIGCMTVLNLTWFRAHLPPCLRRSGSAQAGARGEGVGDREF
jgi:hypothetical protein